MAAHNKMLNPCGIYLVYDKCADRTQEEFCKALTQGNIDLIYHINEWSRREGTEGDKRYIVSMSKEYHDGLTEELKESMQVVIRFYRQKDSKLKPGTTHAFFIRSDSDFDKFKENVLSMFNEFSSINLIKEETYDIYFPQPYPNGEVRNYAIVTFRKINNVKPISFINKFRALIDGSYYNGIKFNIDWASFNVVKDVKSGKNKVKKTGQKSPSAAQASA